MDTEFDIIIAGGGLTGLSLAASLVHLNYRILVVEAGNTVPVSLAGKSGYEPRVSALNMASISWLNSCEAWPLITESNRSRYSSMAVWDADGTGEINFSASLTDHSQLGYIVENNSVQQALLDCLNTPNIKILNDLKIATAEYEPKTGTVNVGLSDGYLTNCNLLVGADGHQSTVRNLSKIKSRQWQYNQKAIITTIKTTENHQHCARQSFTTGGPLGFLPLPSELHCSIVWSLDNDIADQTMALSDSEFCELLTRQSESRMGKVTDCDKRYMIPLSPSLADTYVKPGIALIGDAAHRIHPLAGQGVNLGFQDAAALYTQIAFARKNNISPGDIILLRRYMRNRQAENLLMAGVMEGFKRLYGQNSLEIRWIRNKGMREFNRATWLKKKIIHKAMGI